MKAIGQLLLIAGIIGAAYFLFAFDTSVPVSPSAAPFASDLPDRVNNLGLMNDKTNGIIASGFAALIGSGLIIAGLMAPKKDGDDVKPIEDDSFRLRV